MRRNQSQRGPSHVESMLKRDIQPAMRRVHSWSYEYCFRQIYRIHEESTGSTRTADVSSGSLQSLIIISTTRSVELTADVLHLIAQHEIRTVSAHRLTGYSPCNLLLYCWPWIFVPGSCFLHRTGTRWCFHRGRSGNKSSVTAVVDYASRADDTVIASRSNYTQFVPKSVHGCTSKGDSPHPTLIASKIPLKCFLQR